MSEPASKLDPEELRPGTHLLAGRLVIGRRIGRGGMSTVYEATDGGRTVAVKIIASAYASDANVCQRFRNEVRLAQALADHPRIVTPYEVGEIPELDGRLYMTMPLIKGTPLGMIADRNDWRRWVAVMADVARTVAELHERGIVHRDIKPGNIILATQHGQDVPYLLDFGSAYSKGDGHVPATAGLTRSDECPGTKLYMAPEQALGNRPAPSFDVYALGLSLYELLAGAHPLAEMSPAQAVQRKCNRELPSLSLREHRPELPEAVLEAVDRALSREPEQRTATAGELAGELDAAVRGGRGPMKLVAAEAGFSTRLSEAAKAEAASGDQRSVAAGGLGSRKLVAAAALLVLGGGLWWGLEGEPERERVSPTAVGGQPEPEPEPTPQVEPEPAPVVGPEATPAADAALEPEPALVKPEPATEPEADMPRRKVETGRPEPEREPCTDVAADAQKASRSRQWSRVLQLTKSARCWEDPTTRTRLRVEALTELGRFAECVEVGSGVDDRLVQRLVKQCEKHLAEEKAP
jgi:eukaryotic-like serine/threonine-protein kinase